MPFDFAPLIATFPAVIRKMPRQQPAEDWDFTSHEFIREWSHDHQGLYVDALYAQRTSNPFAVVHGNLAKGLNKHPSLVVAVREIQDPDLFGRKVPCMTWRRATSR